MSDNFKVDSHGNSNGPATPVPAPPIETGGLSVNEIAAIEGAKARALAEAASAAAVAKPVLDEYGKQGGSR